MKGNNKKMGCSKSKPIAEDKKLVTDDLTEAEL
jgi:hypothetical protein